MDRRGGHAPVELARARKGQYRGRGAREVGKCVGVHGARGPRYIAGGRDFGTSVRQLNAEI